MINDKKNAGTSADDSDKTRMVASAIDGRNHIIREDVHRSLQVGRDSGDDVVGSAEVAGTLTASRGSGFRSNGTPIEGVALTRNGPRRLTPIEYERAMGYPDGYTQVPNHRGKPAADGPRYQALGNSMAVPIVGWLCEEIAKALVDPKRD